MKRKLILGLANILFVSHLILGIVILTGWLFPQFKYFYIGLLFFWMGSWLILGYCPPTKWEFLLRKKYNENINPNSEFIQYYMFKFFNKNISSNKIMTGGIVIFSVLLLLTIIK
ncbi:MAG: DUF2784 family protein [Candidatus Paceibacterota bacterium]